MNVIMGATGNIGSQLSDILLKRNEKVRAIGRSAQRLKPLVDKGAEAAIGDVADVDFLTKAFNGADAVFGMIPPAYTETDFRGYYNKIGANIVRAIHTTGVRHVVFLSSIGGHLPDKTGPIKGLHDVEGKLRELGGVNILILRPTYFMENLLANIPMIKNMGITGSGIKGDMKFAMIATRDIAHMASGYLLKRDFSGVTVRELLGERDVSMNEVAKIFGDKIGIPDLKYVQFSAEEEKKGLMDFGMSDDASDQMIEMNQAINEGLIAGNMPRNAENTTRTTIEAFAGNFADIYNNS